MALSEEDIKSLESQYVMLRKHKVFAFIGGVFAFVVASGIISYVAALSTIQGTAGKKSMQLIQANATKSSEMVTEMQWINYPIGSIIAYAGDSSTIENTAWRLCDGSEVSRKEFQKLFEIIGTSWGSGDGEVTFELPDLRGVFLRGADYGANKDPGAHDRFNGRNLPGEVGSFQPDAFQAHQHITRFTPNNQRTGNNSSNYGIGPTIGERDGVGEPSMLEGFGEVRYAAETRPINAYVNWLIKVR